MTKLKIFVLIGMVAVFAMVGGMAWLRLRPGSATGTAAVPAAAWAPVKGAGTPGAAAALKPAAVSAADLAAIQLAANTSHGASGSRLQSTLASLAALPPGSSASRSFAAERGLALVNGHVRAVVEARPSRAAAATAVLKGAGATIETASGNLIQALVPVEKLNAVAGAGAVSMVRPPRHAQEFAGSYTTEGLFPMNGAAWQAGGNRGAGMKVAILDPGFGGYADRQATGDLPANLTVKSFRADGDITGGGEVHGTACAEIVYDIAPDAQYYLVNFNTDVELANAVNWLISQHVDVISSSWGFFGGSPGDGSGEVDNLVNQARNNGILWTAAAGNEAQGHWTGTYNAGGSGWTPSSPSPSSGLNEIDSGYGGAYISAGETINLYMNWNQWPSTTQGYDLYLWKSGDPSPVAASTWTATPQTPEQELQYIVPASGDGYYYAQIVNQNDSGNETIQFYSFPGDVQYYNSYQSLGGSPADSPDAVTTGAVRYNSNTIEPFSSQGPTVDGRTKPDITGYDGVSTATYGPINFYGTSAAGPHAAGEAALLKSVNPSLTPAQIQSEMEVQALHLGTAGKNDIYGSGRLRLIWPEVSGITPAVTFSAATTISASLTDLSGSGINPATVTVSLDGSTLAGCSATATSVSCPATGLSPGQHTVSISASDNNGDTGTGTHSFNYYASGYFWTWYDNQSSGASNWVLLANPPGGASSVNFGLSIAGQQQNLPGGGAVSSGQTLTAQFPGLKGGPVSAGLTSAASTITSQRVLWAGDSLEEVPGQNLNRLSSHYYWPWYDEKTPGMTDWVLISNLGVGHSGNVQGSVSVTLKLGGSTIWSGTVAPGAEATPQLAGRMGGPLEIVSTGGDIITSQRVLNNYGAAFNELPGIPAAQLSDRYLWTWYDGKTPGMTDWVLIANPDNAAAGVYYKIDIAGGCETPGADAACLTDGGTPLAPGQYATPQFPGVMNGPVVVTTYSDAQRTMPAPSIASQRSLSEGSFEEVPGMPASLNGGYSALSPTYYWTWYDQKSAGSQNWVLVANPDPNPADSIYYEVTIGSSATPMAFGTLAGGQKVTPRFPGIMNGPVKVEAWADASKSAPANVVASQRVLWSGNFNEVLGTVPG